MIDISNNSANVELEKMLGKCSWQLDHSKPIMKQNRPDESFQIYINVMHKEAFLNTSVPEELIYN